MVSHISRVLKQKLEAGKELSCYVPSEKVRIPGSSRGERDRRRKSKSADQVLD